MSDGRKFIKLDANLSPEDRLTVVERNYSVILERIQSYDQVLTEFANINSDLNKNFQSIEKLEKQLNSISDSIKEKFTHLNTRINDVQENQKFLINSLNNQCNAHSQLSEWVKDFCESLQRDSEFSKSQIHNISVDHSKTKNSVLDLEKNLYDLKNCLPDLKEKFLGLKKDLYIFKTQSEHSYDILKSQIEQLLSSFQEMPQFNEWATKIYIKVCNEINEKQKAFYQELDKRSQQLKEQLASDPYTAESVKNILKEEMDALALDGKNAYIKATNASQQIQLVEKKLEKINLILKKYELSISN